MKSKIQQLRQKQALLYETSPKRRLVDLLSEAGIEIPRPKKLNDRELTAKLWRVIHTLLRRSIVIGNTDHLSDRELYTLLWNETLRKEFVISPHFTLHIDMTRTGADDGMPIYLKYYATEAQRRMYADFYPAFEMPEHVDPPRRRDHLIPDVPPISNRNHLN